MLEIFLIGNKKGYIFIVFNLMDIKLFDLTMAMVRLDGFLIDWIISFTYNCLMLGRRQSW
jgi:hypothetical protein